MKKGLKRLLGGLLAVVMVLSLVLVTPTAEGNSVDAATGVKVYSIYGKTY